MKNDTVQIQKNNFINSLSSEKGTEKGKNSDKERAHYIGQAFQGDPYSALDLICLMLKKFDYVSVDHINFDAGVAVHR
jgi:hypothetical protein